jgi:uncharacterized membrane protein YfcA
MKPAQFFAFLGKLFAIIVAAMVIIGLFFPVGTVKAASNVFGLPFPMSDDQAHVTDGIMAWGIIIVAIIFIGTFLGSRVRRKRQPREPKRK